MYNISGAWCGKWGWLSKMAWPECVGGVRKNDDGETHISTVLNCIAKFSRRRGAVWDLKCESREYGARARVDLHRLVSTPLFFTMREFAYL